MLFMNPLYFCYLCDFMHKLDLFKPEFHIIFVTSFINALCFPNFQNIRENSVVFLTHQGEQVNGGAPQKLVSYHVTNKGGFQSMIFFHLRKICLSYSCLSNLGVIYKLKHKGGFIQSKIWSSKKYHSSRRFVEIGTFLMLFYMANSSRK